MMPEYRFSRGETQNVHHCGTSLYDLRESGSATKMFGVDNLGQKLVELRNIQFSCRTFKDSGRVKLYTSVCSGSRK